MCSLNFICVSLSLSCKVHARDIIDKLLKAGCTSPNAFEWLSQLRLYWVIDPHSFIQCIVMCLLGTR